MSTAEWHRRVTLIGDRHLELMLKSRSSTLAITNMYWRSINESLMCLKFRSVVVLRFRACRVLLKTFNVLSSATENTTVGPGCKCGAGLDVVSRWESVVLGGVLR